MYSTESRINSRMINILENEAQREKFRAYLKKQKNERLLKILKLWCDVYALNQQFEETEKTKSKPPKIPPELESESLEWYDDFDDVDMAVKEDRISALQKICGTLEKAIHEEYTRSLLPSSSRSSR